MVSLEIDNVNVGMTLKMPGWGKEIVTKGSRKNLDNDFGYTIL